jgi:gas vesicle protein
MAFLRRLFTLTTFACLSGLVGVGVGFLFAPAKGSDTRAWVASLVNQHSPSVQEGMRKAGESVDTAVDYVASQVDAITDGN